MVCKFEIHYEVYLYTQRLNRESARGEKKNDAIENLVNIWYIIESHTHCDLNGEFKNTEKNYTKYLIVQWMAPKPKQYQMRSGEK